nr:hypothetical protein [Methylobacterium sp. GC_Met_2]
MRTSLVDGGKPPPEYEMWSVATERVERKVRRSGVEVVRVPIEADVFTAWCERAGLSRDALARARFAAVALEVEAMT